MTTETKKPAKWVDEVTLIPMGTDVPPFPMTPAVLFLLLKISADSITMNEFISRGMFRDAQSVTAAMMRSLDAISGKTKEDIIQAAIASTTIDIFSGDEPQIITPDSTFKH